MKKSKRLLLILMALSMIAVIAACGGGDTPQEPGNTGTDTQQPDTYDAPIAGTAERSEVEFWYLWAGEEAQVLENLIARFNESQQQYTVIGQSIPDVQTIVARITGGTGPDIAGNFSENVASYSDVGMIHPLDEFMARDGYDMSDFAPGIIPALQYQGQTMALPINLTTFMLYCNVDLLEAAGLAPPQTVEEMLDAAVATTVTGADGSIEVLGYPDFPAVYFLDNMTFALGGDFVSADGTYTPDNPGTIAALENFAEYRRQFGVDKITAFTSSARYMDALADPFMTGHQTMRIDGPWFGSAVRSSSDVNYVAVPLPHPEGRPELANGGKVNSSIFFISSMAQNKDGAWAFLSWLHEVPQMVEFNVGMGNIPSRMSAWSDPAFAEAVDFKAYTDLLGSSNLRPMPVTPTMTEFTKILTDFSEFAMTLQQSPAEAMADAAAEASKIN